MISIKKCERCDKRFVAASPRQRFCAKECRTKNAKARTRQAYTKSDQLCWNCVKCTGGCDWSGNFIPIKGWTAMPVHKIDAGRKVNTYSITACPEFVRG